MNFPYRPLQWQPKTFTKVLKEMQKYTLSNSQQSNIMRLQKTLKGRIIADEENDQSTNCGQESSEFQISCSSS